MAYNQRYEDLKLKNETSRIADKAKRTMKEADSISRQHRARARNDGVDSTPPFKKMLSDMNQFSVKKLMPGEQGKHVLGKGGR